jgi:molybdate transport system permease protein
LRRDRTRGVFSDVGGGCPASSVNRARSTPAWRPRPLGRPSDGATVSAFEWQIVWFTFWMAVLATASILLPGILVAWFLARRTWPGKAIIETLVTLPLVMPPVATGLILLRLLGRKGPIGSFLHQRVDMDIVFTWRAVVIAMAVMSFPLLVRGARIGFESVSPRLEQVAATLGASSFRIFATVTLPLAIRGIVAGSVLAFARALGEFGATVLVAGNIPGRTTTISVSIYSNIQLGHDSDAFRLLVVSVVLSFAAVWMSEWIFRRSAAVT